MKGFFIKTVKIHLAHGLPFLICCEGIIWVQAALERKLSLNQISNELHYVYVSRFRAGMMDCIIYLQKVPTV